MSRLMAVTDFVHPTRGQVLREEIWEQDDTETVAKVGTKGAALLDEQGNEQRETLTAKLIRDDTALPTKREVRHMTKVKALTMTEQKSTGNVIFEGQVLALPDDDANTLVAAGHAREAHDDEKITRDVGKLRDAQGPRTLGEED